MRKPFETIKKFFIKIWEIAFYVLGAPYEQQAKKLDWDEKDEAFRGPQNPKTKNRHYRPNKVSKKS